MRCWRALDDIYRHKALKLPYRQLHYYYYIIIRYRCDVEFGVRLDGKNGGT